jgi:GTP pyrophosphokinase
MLIEYFLQNGKVKLGDAFITGLEFTGIDIVGVVKELTTIISEDEKINMKSLNFDTNDGVFEGK